MVHSPPFTMVNAYDESGWTPLLKAAYHGHVEVARELIRANADVCLKVKESRSGRTVLHIVAVYIYLLLKFILGTNTEVDKQGAEANMYWKVRESGRTVLHVAACCGHEALVKLFLETDVNMNEQDDEGRTALMLAVEKGHSAVVAELVKAGADVSVKDKKGMSTVLLAKSYDTVRQLVGDVDSLSRDDCSRILWHACDVGDLSMVRSVIEAGCDVDHVCKGHTPMMMATGKGHDDIVKELILANCDVSFKSGILYHEMGDAAATFWVSVSNTLVLIRQAATYAVPKSLCSLLLWMKFQMDVEAALWIDPVWGCLVLLVMSVLAIIGLRLMPESRTVTWLGPKMVAIAMIMAMKVVTVAGPVAWTAFLMAIVVIPLVVQVGRASVGEVTEEVAWTVTMTVLNVMHNALLMCAGLVMVFVVPVTLVWSPRDITGTEVVAGILIIMVIIMLKRMVQWHVLKALLEGVIANVEQFIIASSCMMIIGSKVFLYHESQTAEMVELLLTITLLLWTLLMVLRIRPTEMTLYRGAAGFLVFEAIKLLKMENALVSPDKPHLVLVLVVLVVLVNVLKHVAKKVVVVVLHLVVAMIEAYLALTLSKEGAELWSVTVGDFVIVAVVFAVVTSIMTITVTALHYAASFNHIKCVILLLEAGAHMFAKSHLPDLLEYGTSTFQEEVKKALSFTTRRVIAVIGNSECGKSTLVAALERTSNTLWKKAINRFRKVQDIRRRTAGIEAVPLSNQRYGEALFYDFAGQSQYHSQHQSFLEAMVSKPEVSVTLLLLVKATEEEDVITQQLYHWLQPLTLRSRSSSPQVVVVGSFLDQVKSKKEACEKLLCCTQSVQSELCLNIQGPCLLDCRHPESRGINQICSFLQEALPINTNSLSYNLHWVLVQVRKFFSTPALRLYEFQTWLQDNAVNLPRNLPTPEEVCQDLSAAGHTLFLLNRQDPSQSWLVLDLPALLHDVYGTLFSGSHSKINQFGLLHSNQLAKLFPNLDLTMLQDILISLEFCIKADPLLLKEEMLQLTIDEGGEGWLYFPALVLAQPCKVFPENSDPETFQWMCWQLRTAEKHFISAHLFQTIILHLAANHVFIQELSPSVKQHCCSVWVNGLSWSSTKGVDVAVQINNSSVVQVVGRSKAGPERLQEYTAAIVQDVTRTIAQLSPKLEATPYIVHPYTHTLWKDPNSPLPDSLYLVSTINYCISEGGDHVLSLSPNTSSIPIGQLFGGKPPPLSTVQDLKYPRVAQNGRLALSHMRVA